MQHVMDLNEWSESEFQRHLSDAYLKAELRSQHAWVLDITFVETFSVSEAVVGEFPIGEEPTVERNVLDGLD
jgi:hypothetical protein